MLDFEQLAETYYAETNTSEDRLETMVDDNDDVSFCREGVPHTIVEMQDNTFLSHENESYLDDTDLEQIDHSASSFCHFGNSFEVLDFGNCEEAMCVVLHGFEIEG